MSYQRVVPARTVTPRTTTRRQVDCSLPDGGCVFGEVSHQEARRIQSLQYDEDKKKFVEKEKKKADKKKEEKWKRYSHVDSGHRLDSGISSPLATTRLNQQMLHDAQSAAALDLERERELTKSKKEQQKKDEKLKKYAHVSTGRRLAGTPSCSSRPGCSEGVMKQEREDEKPVNTVGGRIVKSEDVPSTNVTNENKVLNSKSAQIDELKKKKEFDFNLNAEYDKALNEKNELYRREKTIEPSTSTSKKQSCETVLNNLDVSVGAVVSSESTSSLTNTDKEEEFRRQMRLARERMQKKYDEEKNKKESE